MFLGEIAAGVVKGAVSIIPGLAQIVGDTLVKKATTQAAREGAQDQRGTDIVLGWLTAVEATNKVKAENQTERQIIAALLMFAVPTSLVYWAAMIDGIPFYLPYIMDNAHKVGSWKIGIPPELKDTALKIIDSFFISAPAIAGASILAKVFRRT